MLETKKSLPKATKQKYIFSYRTKDGDIKFMYRLALGKDEITGKPRNTTARGFHTIAEALAAREVKKEKFEARKKASKNKPILFRDLATIWLEDYKVTVESSTLDKTKALFKNHILPVMGDLEFEDIKASHCVKFIREFSLRLVNFEQLIHYASRTLNHGVLLDYISHNPFNDLDNGQRRGVKDSLQNIAKRTAQPLRKYFTSEELELLLDELKSETNAMISPFFRLLAYTGCRKGEALALTWEDIDFDNQKITFNKAVSTSIDKGKHVKGTKKDNVRTIELDEETLEILKTWRITQKDILNISNSKVLKKKQLVFQNTNNGYIHPSSTEKWLANARKKLPFSKEMEFTPHALRHTHATMCAANSVDLIKIKHRLGHSDIETTETYIHATEQGDKETCYSFVDAIKNKKF